MHLILIRIGPVKIGAYGVMMALAFLGGLWVSVRQGRRRGLRPEIFLDLMIWLLVAGMIGARALFIALDPVVTWKEFPFYWRQGLSWYGGLAAGVLAGWLFSRRVKVPFLTLADSCAPGIALGYGIARIGCFLNGCCYGAPTQLPWAVRFQQDGGFTEPSHPTQIYSALGSWAIFAFLLLMSGRLKQPGRLFSLYLVLYGVLRGVVEIFRKGYTAEVLVGPLTYGQVASIALIVLGLLLFWRLGRT